jgi:hypothetical protein
MVISGRIDIMTNNETSVTSEKINKPKKAVSKKAVSKKVAKTVEFDPDAKDGDGDGYVQDGTVHERKIEVNESVEEHVLDNKNMLILFESGAGYSTGSGIRFSQQRKMAEVPLEEAKQLLSFENFRLPNDEEKEMYYNNLED